MPALAGADELSGIGEMEAAVTGSYAQMVCDDEIAAGVRRLRRGCLVDQDTLAVDVIADVMDGPRHFVASTTPRAGCGLARSCSPTWPSGRAWDEWDHAGRDGFAERAQAEAERLLAPTRSRADRRAGARTRRHHGCRHMNLV